MTGGDLLAVAAVVTMSAALLLVPLGLPGVWIMIGILTVATALDEVAPALLLVLVAAAVAAEFAEYVIVERSSARYGASRKVYWGAIAGGLAGTFVGFPVPLLGPLLGGVAGTFLGAAAVGLIETRHARVAGRGAWGAVVGRVLAAALKTGVGFAILVLGGAALLVR